MRNLSDASSAELAQEGTCELIEQAVRHAAAGDWNEARVLFTKAVDVDPSPAVLIAFAVALADRDQSIEAMQLLYRAWTDACRLNSPPMRAVCCGNLAILHRRLGNVPRAKQFQQLALAAEMESAEFSRHATLSSTQLVEAAAQFSDDGDHPFSEKLLSAARHTVCFGTESTKAATERALIDSNSAILRARCGMIRSAVRGLFRSSRQHGRNADAELRAHDLSNLGHLLQGIGRLAEAAWCFRNSSQSFAAAGAVQRSRDASRFERETRRRAAYEACQPQCN